MTAPVAMVVPSVVAHQTQIAAPEPSPAPTSIASSTMAAPTAIVVPMPVAGPNPIVVPAAAAAPSPIVTPNLTLEPVPVPIKTYRITGGFPTHTVLHNNQPFLWSKQTVPYFRSAQLRLSVGSARGPIVATKMWRAFHRGPALVLLGRNPAITPKEQWTEVPKREVGCELWHQGRKCQWYNDVASPTRPHAWGLLKDSDGRVLAACTTQYDQVDFFEELGGDSELLCLMGLLGRRNYKESPLSSSDSVGGDGCGSGGDGGCGGGDGGCGS